MGSINGFFEIDEVQYCREQDVAHKEPAPIGVLEKFTGTFNGRGLNTIFRPNSGPPPLGTSFPQKVKPIPPKFPSDNVLELNLTEETIDFSNPLSRVPNRGFKKQGDIFLNGVSYVQKVNDVTHMETGKGDSKKPVGIHFETGLWMNIPATNDNPILGDSLVRMGSIPHGTTINAAALAPARASKDPPFFPAIDLRPFPLNDPSSRIGLDSLSVDDGKTPRLPQNLSKFVAAGTITQDILDDPNTILRSAIEGQNIIQTTAFTVSTTPLIHFFPPFPPPPVLEFGGGTDNIGFLLGDVKAQDPNADVVQIQATFWIETVEYSLSVPAFKPGQSPLQIPAPPLQSGQPGPVFLVTPPYEITSPKTITVTSTQIQYSQMVVMNFDKLSWPHVSVSTLVPAAPVPVPDSVWDE